MKKTYISEILYRLDTKYGTELPHYLHHENAFQLLIATILSAQCTDARVNMVTPALFEKYPTVEAFAKADLKELEEDIHSTGFYHNKAKNIIACANKLLSDFDGIVPSDIDELTSLPGVGRKTANVIRSHIFGEPSMVVDTHVGRISRKLGLTKETDPVKVEFALMKAIPKDHWSLWNVQIIALGRTICTARGPKCEECFLNDLCPTSKQLLKKNSGSDSARSNATRKKINRKEE